MELMERMERRRLRARAASVALAALACVGAALAACEVPEPPPSSGGIDDDGADCGPGVVVVSTKYQSVSVAFVRWDGEVVSPHVMTSGSVPPGLSAALSGDVVTATVAAAPPAPTSEVVLVDRYPAGVLTWIDVASGEPTKQLPIAKSYPLNAQDYVAVREDRGYATRYEVNPDPGREPFDEGGDVVVIDPRGEAAIVGRIGFEDALAGDEEGLTPSPSRMVVDGDRLVVLLTVYSTSFTRSGDARLAVIDTTTDAVVAVHRLAGLRGCTALALAPAGGRVAVGCSGTFGGDATPSLDDAGVAVVDLADGAIVARTDGAALGGPPAFSIAFASDDALLVPTFGQLPEDGPARDDTVAFVPLDGGPIEPLIAGGAFEIGEVRCARCGTCLVADAGRGVLHRLVPVASAADGASSGGGTPASAPRGLTLVGEVRIEDGVGLPPRFLGELPRGPSPRGEPADAPAR